MKQEIVCLLFFYCALLTAWLSPAQAACNVDARRFYYRCRPSYRVDAHGMCTTRVKMNRLCVNSIQSMNNDCKPCCEQYGVRSSRRGSRPNPCVEQTLFPPTSCPTDQLKKVCKVPFAGESENLVAVLCDKTDPSALCQSYLGQTKFSCTECCTNDAFLGGGADMPHCTEVFPNPSHLG